MASVVFPVRFAFDQIKMIARQAASKNVVKSRDSRGKQFPRFSLRGFVTLRILSGFQQDVHLSGM